MDRLAQLQAELVRPPMAEDVAAVVHAYPAQAQSRFLEMRALLFAVAERLPDPVALDETLKWGEPAYRPRTQGGTRQKGTTVRLHWKPNYGDKFGLFVPCQSTVIVQMRELYGELLELEGNRALWLPLQGSFVQDPVEHFFSLALQYRK